MKMDDALLLRHEVLQQIRHAAASERAAGGHEDKYENSMKTAGASMYAAFRAALLEQPDYAGRQVNEKVIERVYLSPTPRPWWDAYLIEAKFTDAKGAAKRDDCRRLIQWHLDPEQAVRRRAQRQIQQAAAQKSLRQRRGMTSAPERAAAEPTTQEMRALHAERAAPAAAHEEERTVSLEDLLGECARLQVAAKKVEAGHRADALAAVRNAARELERYVP